MFGADAHDAPMARYLAYFRGYYPEILGWYARLAGDVASGRRTILVSWDGGEIQGLAIAKHGLHAKLCHISVSPSARDRGLGRVLMRSAIDEMRLRGARAIHVTTGEEVLREHGAFFAGSGFRTVDWQPGRYRRGASEVLWRMDVNLYMGGPLAARAKSLWSPTRPLVAATMCWSVPEQVPSPRAPVYPRRLAGPRHEQESPLRA